MGVHPHPNSQADFSIRMGCTPEKSAIATLCVLCGCVLFDRNDQLGIAFRVRSMVLLTPRADKLHSADLYRF
jgi:hypothetical protein